MKKKSFQIENCQLYRYPDTKDPNLKAWNAADEYILSHCQEVNINLESENILIINDQFGAITTCLADYSPWYWTDSFLSKTAIQKNLQKNNIDSSIIHEFKGNFLDFKAHSVDKLEKLNSTIFDLVLIRIPKHLSLLEFQLSIINQLIHESTVIVAAGMTKEIHNSTLALFEEGIGPTKTSLAKKKARLILPEVSKNQVSQKTSNTLQKTYSITNPLSPSNDIKVCGLPGVFSRDNLDIGTRALLEFMPPLKQSSKVIDLGCGSGVIGAVIAQAYPSASLTLTDESQLAIESSRQTFLFNNLEPPNAFQTDALTGIDEHSVDYVLCNPPFHQQNTQTLSIANKMFRQSAKCLNKEGVMFVVANRHLKYGNQLKKYFSDIKIISNHNKFIVWHCSLPR